MARFTLPRDLYHFNAKNTITDACMGPPASHTGRDGEAAEGLLL
jgi:hypothetical protein